MHGVVPARVRVGYGGVAEVYGAFFGGQGAGSEGPGSVGVDFCGVDVGDVGAADGRSGKCGGMAGGLFCSGDERGDEEGGEDAGEKIGGGGWHSGWLFFLLCLVSQQIVDVEGQVSYFLLIPFQSFDVLNQHPSCATDEQPRPHLRIARNPLFALLVRARAEVGRVVGLAFALQRRFFREVEWSGER